MSRKRGTNVFNESLKATYPFIKKTKSESDVRCDTCNNEFSIAHGGKSDIESHLKSVRHKKSNVAASSSKSVSNFFMNSNMTKADMHIEKYFTEDNSSPVALKRFFEDPMARIWLLFLRDQVRIVSLKPSIHRDSSTFLYNFFYFIYTNRQHCSIVQWNWLKETPFRRQKLQMRSILLWTPLKIEKILFCRQTCKTRLKECLRSTALSPKNEFFWRLMNFMVISCHVIWSNFWGVVIKQFLFIADTCIEYIHEGMDISFWWRLAV